jgi:hypothetical protein
MTEFDLGPLEAMDRVRRIQQACRKLRSEDSGGGSDYFSPFGRKAKHPRLSNSTLVAERKRPRTLDDEIRLADRHSDSLDTAHQRNDVIDSELRGGDVSDDGYVGEMPMEDREMLYEDVGMPRERNQEVGGRKIVTMEKMSRGQIMARDVLMRALDLDQSKGEELDKWDPVSFQIDPDRRKELENDITSDVVFMPTPGLFAPPIRGKGLALYSKDNALYKMMVDVSLSMRGLTQVMALILDGDGDSAVVHAANLTLLNANVLSALNAERMRIHLPRRYANELLKPRVEPLMRKTYKLKAREIAQELKYTSSFMGGLFRRGGRSFRDRRPRERFIRKPWRSGNNFSPRITRPPTRFWKPRRTLSTREQNNSQK